MAREVKIIWTTAKVSRLLREGVGHGERGEDIASRLLKETGVNHGEREVRIALAVC